MKNSPFIQMYEDWDCVIAAILLAVCLRTRVVRTNVTPCSVRPIFVDTFDFVHSRLRQKDDS